MSRINGLQATVYIGTTMPEPCARGTWLDSHDGLNVAVVSDVSAVGSESADGRRQRTLGQRCRNLAPVGLGKKRRRRQNRPAASA